MVASNIFVLETLVMSEAFKETTISPYAAFFGVIEEFSKQETLSTLDAYRFFDHLLVEYQLDPTIYLSMAITSGGYSRDSTLTIGEVINKNSEFGSLAAEALILQFPVFDKTDVVVPSELGKVANWSQADYLLWWSHVITGVDVDSAAEIEASMKESGVLNARGFVDASLDKDSRWKDYAAFALRYAKELRVVAAKRPATDKLQPNNVQAAIFILDKELSLGARAEALLCKLIGIPPQFQLLDTRVIDEASEAFRAHTRNLRALGASALGTSVNAAPDISFVGISSEVVSTDIAFMAGLRKTGLINALFAKEFYLANPERKPPRHNGHSPLSLTS